MSASPSQGLVSTLDLITAADEARISLRLLGSFELLVEGRRVDLPVSVQRLIALLAIENRPMARRQLAGVLWPDKSDPRAAANLRSTLWRLKNSVTGLVDTVTGNLALTPELSVDIHELLPDPRRPSTSPFVSSSTAALMAGLPAQTELLIDWYDEWVVVERERVRQQTLRALETAAAELSAVGLFAEAIGVGSTAIRLAPLRESAHRAVIEVHLAEGNYAEAVRQYEAFSAVLYDAFGVGASDRLRAIFGHARNEISKAS